MIRNAPVASLTLAIPYYAGFELTLQTLKSIASQSHKACEVLVCDDSPSGLSAQQVARMHEALNGAFPLTVLRNARNLGMALTWNRCLDEARTELVTIVHGDDLLAPDYAQAMVGLAEEEPAAAAVFCGAKIISETGDVAFSFPDFYKKLITPTHQGRLRLSGDSAVSSLLRGNYIFCPTLCYRKAQLGSRRFDPDYRMVPDLDLLTRVLLDGGSLVGVPERPLYHYRRHSQNATQHLTKELTRFTEENAFYASIASRAAERGYTRSLGVARGRVVIKNNLLFCIARDLLHGNFTDGRQKARLFRTLFLARRTLS